jgi:hypothetical protein
MYWVAAIFVFFLLLLVFIIIARKGRELRRAQPLPPPAKIGFLRWTENGKNLEMEVHAPFYIGKKTDANVVVSSTRADYEVCIFYHQERFAFQALDRAGEVLLNGEEKLAGYLSDGDVLKIGGRDFSFRCL